MENLESIQSDNLRELKDIILEGARSREIDTECPAVSLPVDYKIISLEPYQLLRNNFRGEFRTSRIEDFKAYCDKFGNAKDVCFVNPESVSAKMIFDLGDINEPGHCDHGSILKLEKTAAYEKLLALKHDTFSQEQLFNFLQDWKNNITAMDSNGNIIPITEAAQNILSIDIKEYIESGHETSDFAAAKSSLAKIEAKAKSGKSLPAGLMFTVKSYSPLSDRDFYLRLSLSKRHGEPALKLRCEGLEEIQEQIIDEFAEQLNEKFGDRVIKGTFSS